VNYYERHIGDYLKDTAHLSLLEHGVYGRLLDVYYTREGAIPLDQVERLVGARSKEERAALASVLDEFFEVSDGKLHNSRCDREIKRYHDKQAKASASANARWKKSYAQTERNANAMRTHSERTANAMRTQCEGNAPSNQTPVTIPSSLRSEGKRASAPPVPEGVEPQTWADWLTLRKAKKAPVTATVIASAEREAQNAGMTLDAFLRVWCARGSQGLQAEWLKPNERPAMAAPVRAVPSAEETKRRQQAEESAPLTDPEKRKSALALAMGAVKKMGAA
jgi:uncharacterized protein YdaU (DUF1376 family)